MNTFLLCLILILYLITSLVISGGDWLFPSSIVMMVYLVSLTFFLSEKKLWDTGLSQKSVTILVVGITVYLVLSIMSFYTVRILRKNNVSKEKKRVLEDNIQGVRISKKITAIILIIQSIILLKYYQDIKFVTSSVGSFSSFSEMIGIYRNESAYGNTIAGLSAFASQGYLLNTAIAYIYLALVVQNVIWDKNFDKGDIIYNSLPIIVFAGGTILTGGRNSIIQLIIAATVFYFIEKRKKYGIKKIKFRSLIKIGLIIFVLLLLFSSMRGIFGRTNTFGTFDYLAMYIGGPIKLFDLFVNGSQIGHTIWGQETFPALLNSFGNQISANLEFRNQNGNTIGNVYTPFRRYYSDFGILGVIVLTAIESAFYTVFYLINTSKKHDNRKINLGLLIYSYIVVGIFYMSIDERLYTAFISSSNLRILLIVVVLSIILPITGKSNGKNREKNR